jgi:hypothetical protein
MTTPGSPKNLSLILLLGAGVWVLALRLGIAGTAPAQNHAPDWPESRASQLVFFAVLEGLYHDGVSNDDVDIIIPPGTNGQPQFDREYFVYACPLCHPAFEAFRLYRHRDPVFGLKARVDTFGPGLDDSTRAQLRSPDAARRRGAVQGLINRWVAQRLDMMRFTASERADITREMDEGRRQGMKMLNQGPSASQSRTNCPICDGSFGACKFQSR